MAFLVRRPGAYSLLVDAGRPGWQHLGVPRGGPADRAAWQLGNALVGNDPTTVALEITWQGPTLEATARHRVVVYGAPFLVKHWKSASHDLEQIPAGHVFTLEPGDEVQIPELAEQQGVRAYVCVRGGFQQEPILGSQSSLEPLKSSQRLDCAEDASTEPPRWFHLEPWPDGAGPEMVRLLPGTQLSRSLRKQLLAATFTVSPDSNRMGLRLRSSVSWPDAARELVSSPVVPGTLQLPSGGQPIILGVDAQTIGGYPRLGHVIAPDLDRLGQLRPGDKLRFQLVDLNEADSLRESHERWLRTWLQRLKHA
jgi:5-oxoprolinase (ATP-hydrolysing) subunit C